MALKLKRYGPLNTVWIEKVAILAAQWGWTRTQNETDLHKVIGKKENLHWTNITSFGFFWVRREHGVNRTSKERSKNRSWKLSGDVQEDDHKGEISQIKIRYEFCWKFSFTPPAAYLPNSPSAAVAVSCYAPVTSAWMNEWMNVCISNSKRKPGLQCHTAADSVPWNCCVDTWVSELEACETTAVRHTVKNTSSVALLQLFPIYTWTVGQRWDITGQDRWQSCFFDLWKETFSLVEVRLFWFMVIAK